MADNPFKIAQDTVKDRSLRGFNAGRTLGDNLLFLPDFRGWLGKSLKDRHLLLFHFFILIIFCLLISRVGFLQLARGETYFSIAERNRLKVVPQKASRGILFDRYGRPLVRNVPSFIVYVNPRLIRDDAESLSLHQYLQEEFPNKHNDLEIFFRAYSRFETESLLIEDVDFEKAMKLMIFSANSAALQVTYEPRREYLYDYGLAHVMGYVGRVTEEERKADARLGLHDIVGKSGIEKTYDEYLRGRDGAVIYQVDALGRESGEVTDEAPVRGTDMQLTIDLDMQKKLYEAMAETLVARGKNAGAGVVLDPQSGEVLALVSYPSYDANIFTKPLSGDEFQKLLTDPHKPLFARAVAGEYPAGSTFKMTLAAAALEEKIITPNFSVVSTGGVWVGNRFFPDWRAGGHGVTNMYSAIANSVNTFFYIIGGGTAEKPGLGVDVISRYAQLFGFASKTNIDLPGESAGFVPTRAWRESQGERWYVGDTYNLSIGQGALLVTPVQIARYVSSFANNGMLITPHLAPLDIYSQKMGSSLTVSLSLLPETLNAIQEGMRRTVSQGTATSMQSVAVPVSGKTGTAQFNSNKVPHSWFAGYAPSDAPKISITVLVEEGGDESLAITVARKFLEQHFNESAL